MLCLLVLCCTLMKCDLPFLFFYSLLLYVPWWQVAFRLFSLFSNIIKSARCVFFLCLTVSKEGTKMTLAWPIFPETWQIKCRFVLQCPLSFSRQVKSTALQRFYSWKHPEKLGQFDLLSELHPFFICSSLNFNAVSLQLCSSRAQHSVFGIFVFLHSSDLHV